MDSIPESAQTQGMVMSLLCRVGWHKWQRRSTDDGSRYLVCRRCGKEGEAGPLAGGIT
jgi:hypothetical protein